MITNIHIENYKQFNDFTMPKLGRVNLIVGKNGAGKSNLLAAIEHSKITHYEQVRHRRVIKSSSIFNYCTLAVKDLKEILSKLGFEDHILLNHETILDLSDGVKTILGTIYILNNFERSIILLDNFGEGLHYSVFQKLWEMIFQLANENDIQVFATTHSWDCIEGFTKAGKGSDAMLTRLGRSARTSENGKTIATQFDISDCEDFVAADHELR